MSHYFTNDNVKSELRNITIKFHDKEFILNSDNGVFSKNKLDFGTRLLLDNLLRQDLSGTLLDVGCGYGVIGIILSSFFDISVEMVDVNKRAVHLAKMNIKQLNLDKVNAFWSDIYSEIDKKYDYIITNPPIRAGKDVVYNILFKARDYLNQGGSLFFVINKDQGAKSTIKDLSVIGNIDVLEKSKGFFVIKCQFR